MASIWNKAINYISTGVKNIAKSQLNAAEEWRLLAPQISDALANESSLAAGLQRAFTLTPEAYKEAGLQQKFGAVMGFDVIGQMGSSFRQGHYGALAGHTWTGLIGGNVGNRVFKPHVAAARVFGYSAGAYVGYKAAGLAFNTVTWPLRALYDELA